MKIKQITAKKILNSLGKETIEATMQSENNFVEASVPQGESDGKFEAKPVKADKAVENLDKIKNKLVDKTFDSIKDFDTKLMELDGTAEKSNLGANLILALSIAFTKLTAKEENKELFQKIAEEFDFTPKLPKFFLLIFEGGKHGSKHLTIQEFMLVTSNIEESKELINKFKEYLDKNSLFSGYGLEGAFTSSELRDADVFKLFNQISPKSQIALDVAESSREGDMLDFGHIINKYNLFSIEDPKDEQDYKGWKEFYENYGDKVLVVADDLTTSNKTLIANAQKENLANAVIIKPNQIGTVSETIEAVKQAQEKDWTIVVSHRGGDTNDPFITDLAVGIGAEYVKFGGLQRGERIAKYNRWREIAGKIDN